MPLQNLRGFLSVYDRRCRGCLSPLASQRRAEIAAWNASSRILKRGLALTLMFAGFSMVTVVNFAYNVWTPALFARVYGWTPAEIGNALKRMDAAPDGAIILSGTGMRTIDMMAATAHEIAVPVLASNICSVWSLTAGWGAPSPWMQAVAAPGLLK